MPSPSPSSSSSPSPQRDRPREWALYKAVMTPVIFVSFLFSLAWVEFRYSMLRSHSHRADGNRLSQGRQPKGATSEGATSEGATSEDCHTRMPAWLHSVVYRRQPYEYVLLRGKEGDGKKAARPERPDDGHYHSMQRKLLKMESDEAFRIRSTVLCVMAAVGAGSLWAAVAGLRWALAWLQGGAA